MRQIVWKSLLGLCLPAIGAAPLRAAELSGAGVEFFEKNIRPVFVENCYKCHSTSSEKVKGGLLLDTPEGLLKGGENGPIIVPGDVEKSRLVIALRYGDKDLQMPPKHQLPAVKVKAFEQWIKMGAPDPRQGGPATKPAPPYNYAEAKQFWSFQPVKDPTPPRVSNGGWPANAIDQFILAKQEELGLTPAPLADRRTLIRRVTFDLTGLPPTPEEVDAFVNDVSAEAWERVVNRLLVSPAYGEKWGRHWLDLVRYADTSGCNADFPVPSAYKYRNWVIDSFNQDKPYDQFLREQIAGDLLPHASDQEKADHIIATGYLAIARRFGSRAEAFHLTIEDVIDNMGKSMLGMTIGCARCHDHKYDPIPNGDYYALYGIFSSTKFAFPGTEIFRHPKDFTLLEPGDTARELANQAAELARLDERLDELAGEARPLEIAERELKAAIKEGRPPPGPKVDPQIGAVLAATTPALAPRSALSLPSTVMLAEKRSAPVPRSLAEVKAEVADIHEQQGELEFKARAVDKAYAVFDGKPADARIQRKGDPEALGEVVPRGFLTILGAQKVPAEEKGSGRKELADWIADSHNPLTPRVMVNRIWQGHFGKGIVQTPNEFGARGKPPTHPQLLDYLASRFIESGWSIKAMHKLILTSHAYQLGSEDDDARHVARNAAIDSGDDGLWHFNRRRLEAEEVRDSLLAVAGTLERGQPGPHPFPPENDWHYTQHKPFVATYESNHRAVYLMQQRIKKQPFLEMFDGADTNAVTAARAGASSPIQALFFMNDPLAHDAADKLAIRVALARPEEEKRIDYAYRLCFGRPAGSEEIEIGHEYLRDTIEKLKEAGVPWDQQARAALASYMRVLLSSNEFFYVD